MLSWNIFKRAVTLIVDNIFAALRISALPYGLLAAVSLYYVGDGDMTSVLVAAQNPTPGEIPDIPEGFVSTILLLGLLNLFVFLWIAVAWHRFVLLSEDSGTWIPPLNGARMLGYLGRSVLLALIFMAITVAIMAAIGVFMPLIALPLIAILSIIMFYRLGLILPAGAIGQPITMAEAWAATKGHSGTVVMLAVLTFLVSLLFQIPAAIDGMSGIDLGSMEDMDPAEIQAAVAAQQPGPISTVYSLVISWMLLLLGVSVLSTLYGHFIEKRPLD